MTIDPIELFTALAHDTRLRCVLLLLRHGELCVCELTHALGVSQPHISRHLAQMRKIGLVSDRREGLWIHYRVHPDLPHWARDVLTATQAGSAGEAQLAQDDQALCAMANRPGSLGCARGAPVQ